MVSRKKPFGPFQTLCDRFLTVLDSCFNGMSFFPWSTLLTTNSVHSAIPTIPFFANYGFHSQFFASFPEPNCAEKNAKRVAAQVFALDQQTILHQVRDRMAETQVVMSRDANRHRSFLTFALGDDVLVHRDSLIATSVSDRKFSKLWLGPVKITKVINDNAYEVSLSPALRSPKQSRSINVTSLKAFVPLSADFESLPPLLLSDMIEQSYNLTAISEVSASTLVTHWLNSDLPVVLSISEYEQFPFARRVAVETDYNSRVAPAAAFHSNPGTFVVVRRPASSRHSTLPRTGRLLGLHDPPRVRGRTQL
ncbi:hypothetical protein JCM33374_g3275 [Metschnikowia sp. JCM 33374]|nr:hypothetical protein JCM33374_g3275 [Metschnikowia sp. JCM 33374]